MRYQGGKAGNGLAPRIAALLHARGERCPAYWEPFVGGCGVLELTDPRRPRYASDLNPDVVEFWRAIQRGWRPPPTVPEPFYAAVRDHGLPSALRGFVGVACSFSGKWFGGYARDGKRNFAAEARRAVTKTRPAILKVRFETGDYRDVGTQLAPRGWLIYCDPPYAGTTQYDGAAEGAAFDSAVFWAWCRERAAEGNRVLISETTAPDDFEIVLELTVPVTLGLRSGSRVERVYALKGGPS